MFLKNKYRKETYSQTGEDLIIDYIFCARGFDKPTYIDIGAHHPWHINNTALFYKKGCRGINIEPDPTLIKAFYKSRVKDINLNIGISDKNTYLDLYIFNVPTLNTFSEKEAFIIEEKHKIKIKNKIKVKTYALQTLLKEFYNSKSPDFYTIDTEGFDFAIIKQINFIDEPPKVICVETISYSTMGDGKKNTQLIDFLLNNGYMIYADTYINTIFVLKSFWIKNK